MAYKYVNKFTGEIHKTLLEAIFVSTMDMVFFKTCRTFRVYEIGRIR